MTIERRKGQRRHVGLTASWWAGRKPQAPIGATLDVWHDAARWAMRYGGELRDEGELAPEVRAFAERAERAIQQCANRVASPAASSPA